MLLYLLAMLTLAIYVQMWRSAIKHWHRRFKEKGWK